MYRIIKRCNCHAKYDTKYIQGGWNEKNTVRHFQDRICCNLKDSVVMIVEKSLLKIIVWTGVESFQQFSKTSSDLLKKIPTNYSKILVML